MARLLRLSLACCLLLALAPALARGAEPPNRNDPCAEAGRNTCDTEGVGKYDRYRYGLRWFGDYRGAVPDVKGATWCIDLRFWYPGKQFNYRERPTDGLKNREGDRVSAAALARMNYVAQRFGNSRNRNNQAATMLYVHGQMGDGAPGEASPSAAGRAAAARYRVIARAAARFAGEYKVEVSAGDKLVAGREATLTVKVATASGRGVPDTTLALEAKGAELPATVKTNSAGTATANFTPTDASQDLEVTATTQDTAAAVPRLFVPTRGKSARNGQRLIAPKAQAYTGEVKADVTSVTPTVVTAATPNVIAAGQTSADKVTITGPAADWKAAVEVRLYGPYRSKAEVNCQGAAAATVNYEAGVGESMTPPVTPSRPGIYAYQLTVAPTAGTEGVTTACPDDAEMVTVQSQPKVVTQVSAPAIEPTQTISDSVVVSGLNGEPATVDAALYGPFPAMDKMSCDGAPVWTGVLNVPGDGTYQTEATTLQTPGYYTYREGLRASDFVQAYQTPCGEAAETTIVRGKPKIVTQVSEAKVTPGAQLTDKAVVSGLGKLSAPVRVELWGPYPTKEAMTCEGTPHATQTFTAEGDGEYTTEPVAVTRAGYYTYREAIDATPAYDAVQTDCGEEAETSLVEAAPKIETQTSRTVVRPGSTITDRIAVTGMGETPATVKVKLYGPYETKAAMDCKGRPYREGSVEIKGDGVVNSDPMKIERAGFYTFVEELEAAPGIPAYTTECGLASETTLGSPLILTGPGDAAVRTIYARPNQGSERPSPTRVRYGRLGIDAPIAAVGIDLKAGALGISKDIGKVGWWRDGAAPGSAKGATLLAGHVDSAKRGAGAFYPLKRARRGDTVTVALRGGGTKRYRVTSMRRRHKDRLPADVFSAAGPGRLVLVTCGGPFLRDVGHYRDNIIVTATPV